VIGWIFAIGAALVVAAGLGVRRRVRRVTGRGLSDDVIRRIEAGDRVQVDDPLDLDEAADEEERFWNESWDEPEPL
jgi:hypothetical protein